MNSQYIEELKKNKEINEYLITNLNFIANIVKENLSHISSSNSLKSFSKLVINYDNYKLGCELLKQNFESFMDSLLNQKSQYESLVDEEKIKNNKLVEKLESYINSINELKVNNSELLRERNDAFLNAEKSRKDISQVLSEIKQYSEIIMALEKQYENVLIERDTLKNKMKSYKIKSKV